MTKELLVLAWLLLGSLCVTIAVIAGLVYVRG